jgi:hypothetical protein
MGVEITDFDKKSKRAFRPYGLAIGKIVLHWNALHQNLSSLFEYLIGARYLHPDYIWHSTDNDYQQRKMLRAVAEKSSRINDIQRAHIISVLNTIDNGLRHNRNDALHAPLIVTLETTAEQLSLHFMADLLSSNPRAKSLLKNSDAVGLLAYLNEQAEWAESLAQHMNDMLSYFSTPPRGPWPDKPNLPHAHRKKSRRAKPRRKTSK